MWTQTHLMLSSQIVYFCSEFIHSILVLSVRGNGLWSSHLKIKVLRLCYFRSSNYDHMIGARNFCIPLDVMVPCWSICQTISYNTRRAIVLCGAMLEIFGARPLHYRRPSLISNRSVRLHCVLNMPLEYSIELLISLNNFPSRFKYLTVYVSAFQYLFDI